MKFPSMDRQSRSAVGVAILASAAFSAVAAAPSISAFDPPPGANTFFFGSPKPLPDPTGPLVHERMPDGTALTVPDRLRQVSLARPFLPVGRIVTERGPCTATWLGDDEGQTYLLTSAHCLGPKLKVATPQSAAFLGWNGRPLAHGMGWSFIPPAAVGWGSLDPANDIAIVKLRTVSKAEGIGKQLEPPLLDDMGDSATLQWVHLIGYGRGFDGYSARFFADRWWSQAAIRDITKSGGTVDVGLRMQYGYRSEEDRAGESGTAIWQSKSGFWALIGVAPLVESYFYPTYSPAYTSATLVAKHAEWIRSIFPGVRLLSDRVAVKIGKPFVSRGNEALGVVGGVYFSVLEKDGTRGGPLSGSLSDQAAVSIVETTVLEERTGNRVTVKLRMQRPANDLSAPISIAFLPEDNPDLKKGRWTGSIELQVRRIVDNGIVDSSPIQLKLDNM